MTRQLDLEVANFVCKFGETQNLVDYLDSVVIPAFFAKSTRSYKGTEYFFTDVEFAPLIPGDSSTLALSCRFIKSTTLTRHQYYDATKGLVPDLQSLDSAPSATAILILSTHRLLYIREVPSAPTPTQFGSTFEYFMKHAVASYRDAQYKYLRVTPGAQKKTRKQIAELIPFPDITVVPVISTESLSAFIGRFETLETLKIEVAPTNNEIDNAEFYKILRSAKKQVKSDTTIVQHRNPKGLNKSGCQKQVAAAKQGNALVFMRGKDKQGDDLKGNNDSFSIRASLGVTADSERKTVIQSANKKYAELVAQKVVDMGKIEDDVTSQIEASYQRFKKAASDEDE